MAFVGWFGPRGLASVVFGLIAVDALAPQASKAVLAAVTVTVAASVLLHGITASPLAARYGAHMAGTHPRNVTDQPEPPALAIRTLNRSRHRPTAADRRSDERGDALHDAALGRGGAGLGDSQAITAPAHGAEQTWGGRSTGPMPARAGEETA